MFFVLFFTCGTLPYDGAFIGTPSCQQLSAFPFANYLLDPMTFLAWNRSGSVACGKKEFSRELWDVRRWHVSNRWPKVVKVLLESETWFDWFELHFCLWFGKSNLGFAAHFPFLFFLPFSIPFPFPFSLKGDMPDCSVMEKVARSCRQEQR